jgi:formate dehydrogenase subunit gamma
MSGKYTLIDKSPREATAAREIALRYGNRPDALLEILHDIQHDMGYIPEAALPALAKALNRSRAEIHGVVTFYEDFHHDPVGRHVIHICRAEACQAMKANELIAMVERFLKVKLGQTTADGAITIEEVFCLGNCALAPAVMVNDKLVGRVDAAKMEKIIAECRK